MARLRATFTGAVLGAECFVDSSDETAEQTVRRLLEIRAPATMELTLVEEGSVQVVEGQPNEVFMSSADDANRVLEACFSYRCGATLLYVRLHMIA